MKLITLILILPVFILGQNYHGIDEVVEFNPGTGQNNGQDEEYFPENIFGFPSEIASATTPESTPDEILSLGLGGEIIVRIKGSTIKDGPGYDFVIYENAFNNPINGLIYSEPAKVAVSQNGMDYFEFPYNEKDLSGCAGTKPTIGSENYDPDKYGGNKFDLADLGLKEIQYIKITDITEVIKNDPEHEYYDPTLTGFDLDAVVGIYVESVTSVGNDQLELNIANIIQNKSFFKAISNTREDIDLKIYDRTGRIIISENISGYFDLNLSDLSCGIYFYSLTTSAAVQTGKIPVF